MSIPQAELDLLAENNELRERISEYLYTISKYRDALFGIAMSVDELKEEVADCAAGSAEYDPNGLTNRVSSCIL